MSQQSVITSDRLYVWFQRGQDLPQRLTLTGIPVIQWGSQKRNVCESCGASWEPGRTICINCGSDKRGHQATVRGSIKLASIFPDAQWVVPLLQRSGFTLDLMHVAFGHPDRYDSGQLLVRMSNCCLSLLSILDASGPLYKGHDPVQLEALIDCEVFIPEDQVAWSALYAQ